MEGLQGAARRSHVLNNDKATESPRIAIRREAVPEGQTGERISIAVAGHCVG